MTESKYEYHFSVIVTSPHEITAKQVNNVQAYMQASCEDYFKENAELGIKVNVEVLGSVKKKNTLLPLPMGII